MGETNALGANEQYGLAEMVVSSTRRAGWGDQLRNPQRWARNAVQQRRNAIAICASSASLYSPEECDAARRGEVIATQ